MCLQYFNKSQQSKYISVSCELMLPLCSSCRRPLSACAHSYGQDTSQHVHAPEDTQWQPQPQTAVHGKRMRESLQKMSRWTWMCVCSVYLCHVALQAWTAGWSLIDGSNVCSTLRKRLGCFREKKLKNMFQESINVYDCRCLLVIIYVSISPEFRESMLFWDRLLTEHCTVNNNIKWCVNF